VKAAIISSGNEVAGGEIVDLNGAFLAEQLTELDAEVVCHLTVGDDKDRLLWAIRQAGSLAELVIMTGGLGPTSDDLTRFALAEAGGVELVERSELVEALETFFRQRGREMAEVNRIQAMLPAGAFALDNPTGTAAGIRMQIGTSTFFALPGVPREMKEMFARLVRPWVAKGGARRTHRVHLHCAGTGESNIMQQLKLLVEQAGRAGDEKVRFGTQASEGVITVKLSSENPQALSTFADRVRAELGAVVFGEGGETLAQVVGGHLRRRKQTLAVAESCTGGLVGKLITDVPGSSDFFYGGWISYSYESKCKYLHVPQEVLNQFGAVSEPCVRAMLTGVLNESGADWAMAITGIAGPGGATEEKPVGLVYIGVGNKESQEVSAHRFGDIGRRAVRYRSAVTALDVLRLMLTTAR